MTNMTLSLPEELHKIMRKHKQIKWSEIARQAMWNEAKKLEIMNKLLSKSELKEEDILELSRKINKGIAKRHIIK